MGLLGFPGVGWLFAGFPVMALVLLIAGPALAWAVIPLAFSPFGQGPLRDLGWRVEFVWLPAQRAAVGGHAAPRAPASPDQDSRAPRRPNRRRRPPGSSRARIVAGLGTIGLVLVALPFVPAVDGLGAKTVRYSYAKRFTREITGPFLSTPRGSVKLFGWRDPQNPYPPDALRVHARDVRGLVIRSAAVDRPGAYQLFDVDRGTAVALSVVRRSPYVAGSRAAAEAAPRSLHDQRLARRHVRRSRLHLPDRRGSRRERDRDRGRLDPHRSRGVELAAADRGRAARPALHGHAAALASAAGARARSCSGPAALRCSPRRRPARRSRRARAGVPASSAATTCAAACSRSRGWARARPGCSCPGAHVMRCSADCWWPPWRLRRR